jgi:hypothetical protein
VAPIKGDTSTDSAGAGHFSIDWEDLKSHVVNSIDRKGEPAWSNSRNSSTWAHVTQEEETAFRGYSLTQAKQWAVGGYSSEALDGISDFAPPIREKRRFIYSEEGDEIDLSAAWAGEDNFMTEWTKREVIPGVAIEFFINLYAGVSASVVNAYIHWIAQAIFAIELAGVDPEISMGVHSQWRWSSKHRGGFTKIRIKREGEIVDSSYWSAMVSPAAFRTFGFAAIVLAADSVGSYADGGIDAPNQTSQWGVKYDSESATILVQSPWSASEFPEAKMTQELREAIEELKKGGAA